MFGRRDVVGLGDCYNELLRMLFFPDVRCIGADGELP
jgi:hypothetical protein